jgi:hypothetical protein
MFCPSIAELATTTWVGSRFGRPVTVTATVFDVTEPLDPLTFVLPAASAERRPAELIVAVGVLDEFHVIVGDMAFPN